MEEKPEFEAFFRYWRPQLHRILSWYEPDKSLIEDAAQETLISAYRYWETLSCKENQRAWLFKIARQRLSDERQRRRAEALCGEITEGRAGQARDSPDTNAVDDRLEIVQHVRKLPEHQIAPVVLHFYGFSDKEIAEITSLSPASVRTYRSRGLRTLKQLAPPLEGGGS